MTQERDPKVIEEFGKRHKRQMMVAIPFIGGIVLLIILQERGSGMIGGISNEVFGGSLLAVVAGLLAFSFKNWRCPACNRYLGKAWSPRFCASCGAPLQ